MHQRCQVLLVLQYRELFRTTVLLNATTTLLQSFAYLLRWISHVQYGYTRYNLLVHITLCMYQVKAKKITFQFNKTARRVRAKLPTATMLLMFWSKVLSKESKTDLPSASNGVNSSFSVTWSNDNRENMDTNPSKAPASASYAARQISASIWLRN